MGFDFNYPISKTRDEVFLIKFRGGFKNAGELLFKAARSCTDFNTYWIDRYPKLSSLASLDEENMFAMLSPFKSEEFLKFMSLSFKHYDKLHDHSKSVLQDYAKLMVLSNPYYASVTNIEMMLHEILTYPFCKRVYFYDTAFSDITKQYLRDTFKTHGAKISIIEGTLLNILTEKPEITTIISDSSDEVVEVIESEPEGSDKFEKKLFLISYAPNLIDLTGTKKEQMKHQKFLSETKQRFKCESNWFQLKYVTRFESNGPEIKLKGAN